MGEVSSPVNYFLRSDFVVSLFLFFDSFFPPVTALLFLLLLRSEEFALVDFTVTFFVVAF